MDNDTRHAADLVRRDHRAAIDDAFRRIPRVALLEIMRIAGVAQRRRPELDATGNAYENGMQALCFEILALAGFDTTSILAAALSASLEGEHHEHGHRDGRPVLDDDHNDEF